MILRTTSLLGTPKSMRAKLASPCEATDTQLVFDS